MAFKEAGISENELEVSKENLSLVTNSNVIDSSHSAIKAQLNVSIWSRLLQWIKKLILTGCFAFTAYKILIKVNKKLVYLKISANIFETNLEVHMPN